MAELKNGIDDYPDERLAEFLDKLEVLCNEYGLFIWGCGCCESPFIHSSEGVKVDLVYDSKAGGSCALDLTDECRRAWRAAGEAKP